MNPNFQRLIIAVVTITALNLARGQSAVDGFDPNANGTIYAVAVQPDGKILIGGDFTTLSPNGGATVTRNHIARLNADGTVDTGFDPDINDAVTSIAVQTDAKILVGGPFFTSVGGVTRNRIARLETNGVAEVGFDPNANSKVLSIAVQADGKILLGGEFTTLAPNLGPPVTRNRMARLNLNGTLDGAFDPNVTGGIFVTGVDSIAVQADGKVLVGGDFNGVGGLTRNFIARLDATTGVADSFDPNANYAVFSMVVQADGKILLGGGFTTFAPNGGATVTRSNVARLETNGTVDAGFDPNVNGGFVDSIAVQANGKILLGGGFSALAPNGGASVARFGMARVEAANGAVDAAFEPSPGGIVFSIAVQADGKILLAGEFATLAPQGGDGVARNRIARLEFDGRLDQTIDLGIAGFNVTATAVQPDGKFLIGGNFTTVLGVARNNIARVNEDGTLDTAFNPGIVDGAVHAIVVLAGGKILVGGGFSTIGGETRNFIARLDATSGLADSFNPNANGVVYALAVSDGKILAGGFFNSIGGETRNGIARLNAATGLADSFDPNANSFVSTLAVQADGKILAGGFFDSIGGETRNRIARLNATTGLADSFNPNANAGVNAIVVQPDGKILVGGDFNGASSIGGVTRNCIARFDATTGLVDSFDPNANFGGVRAIAVQADGKILVGGDFFGPNGIGGEARNHIARLDAATGLADSLDPNANGVVYAIAVQANGKILAGGTFTNIGGQRRNYFARLNAVILGPLQLTAAVSRKMHGFGTFDIDLLTANFGPECRSSGGAHTLVFTFNNNVVSGSASLTAGAGSVSGSPTFSANTMTVNLTGVTDVQKITLKLSSVTDAFAQALADTTVSVNILAGDTSGNKAVNSTDVSQTKLQSGAPATAANFRSDVVVSGSINATDVSLVKLRSGFSVP